MDMKTSIFISFFCIFCLIGSIKGYSSKIIENQVMKSKIMPEDVHYSVYLPPCYDVSDRSYPIVYLLHGYTDNETAWVQFGDVQRIADQGIENGTISPCIIVMPDGKETYYINTFEGKEPFEDMFIKEFIPHIEKEYRVRKGKEFRGISGLSMGGYGSLLLSLKHPDLFTACAAYSAAVRTEENMRNIQNNRYKTLLKKLYGQENDSCFATEYWQNHSPIHLMNTLPENDLKSVKWYIDCGDDDFLYEGNSVLHITMRKREIPHEYRVRDGAHSWSYWRKTLPYGLEFISKSFHR